MKIKPVFTVEATKKPLRFGKGGSYVPETHTFVIVAPNDTVQQVIRIQVRED